MPALQCRGNKLQRKPFLFFLLFKKPPAQPAQKGEVPLVHSWWTRPQVTAPNRGSRRAESQDVA